MVVALYLLSLAIKLLDEIAQTQHQQLLHQLVMQVLRHRQLKLQDLLFVSKPDLIHQLLLQLL